MTDADVDGSHIRTLLLTFFYRQMPELIERGHVYIAQPPLYKIKKGKQEVYVKDDIELDTYLLNSALNSAALHVTADAPALSGVALETLAKEHIAVENIISRLAGRYDETVLRAISTLPDVTQMAAGNLDELEAWTERFSAALPKGSGDRAQNGNGGSYSAQLDRGDEDGEGVRIAITKVQHGVGSTRYLPREFFETNEYGHIMALAGKLNELLGEGAYVQRGERSATNGAPGCTPAQALRYTARPLAARTAIIHTLTSHAWFPAWLVSFCSAYGHLMKKRHDDERTGWRDHGLQVRLVHP